MIGTSAFSARTEFSVTTGFLALAGRTSEARKVAARLRYQWDHGVWVPAYSLALMYLSLGDEDEGLRFLQRAFEQHSCSLLEINTEPLLLALRGNARFEAIRGEFHLPEPSAL